MFQKLPSPLLKIVIFKFLKVNSFSAILLVKVNLITSNGFIWFGLFNKFIFQKCWSQEVCIHLWNINSSDNGTPEPWRNYWNIFWFYGINIFLFTLELLSHLSLRSQNTQNSVSLKRKAHSKDKTALLNYANWSSRYLFSGCKMYIVVLIFFK